MADEEAVHGEQPEPFLLGLHEQQFVERVPVAERRLKGARGMADRHWQECHVLVFQHGNHIGRVEPAFALAEAWRALCLSRISQIDTALA